MKYIFFFILSLIAPSIYGQSAMPVQPPVPQDFTMGALSSENLSAFEQMGIQKLKDFFDYLNIISDHSYDQSFRQHASGLAVKLFTDKSALISIPSIVDSQKHPTIEEFMEAFQKLESSKLVFEFIGTNEQSNFLLQPENFYKGEINFNQSLKYYEGDVEMSKEQKVLAEIYLKREEKEFGDLIEEIWRVSIGKVEVLK